MGRAIKPELKLIDLYYRWWDARLALEEATSKMIVTPSHIRNEVEAHDLFIKRLEECNC